MSGGGWCIFCNYHFDNIYNLTELTPYSAPNQYYSLPNHDLPPFFL